jgi:hypothetical protein
MGVSEDWVIRRDQSLSVNFRLWIQPNIKRTRRAGTLRRVRLPLVIAICIFSRLANSFLFYLSGIVGVLT